jgi:Glycosyltransferase family 87
MARFDGQGSKTLRQIGAAILAVIFLLVFAASTYFKTNISYVRSYNLWNVFHYYLGAKYFSEIGYFDLYPCALEADQEAGGIWNEIEMARDMQTYRMISRSMLPHCPRANFTPNRWNEFSQDVEYLARHGDPDYFVEVFSDKGFNPPPSWTFLAKPVAQAIPIFRSRVLDIVFNLDVVAVFLGLLIVWRSCGGAVALLTSGLVVFYFGSFGRIGGNFFQYFWFPFVVAAIALWAKNRPWYSGAMLGAATGLQIFPVFFAVPIVLRGMIEFVRGQKKVEWRPYFSFSCGLMAVILASFCLGSLAGRGPGAWSEWRRKISIHRDYLRGEIFNIGLANLTATALSKDHEDADNYADDVPHTFVRLESLKSHILLYYSLCGILLAMWFVSLARAPAGDLFGQGFLIMYIAVTMSPFYYLPLVLLPFLFWKSGRFLRRYVTYGTTTLVAFNAILFPAQPFVTFEYLPHALSAYSIGLFLFGLAIVSILSYRSPARPLTS